MISHPTVTDIHLQNPHYLPLDQSQLHHVTEAHLNIQDLEENNHIADHTVLISQSHTSPSLILQTHTLLHLEKQRSIPHPLHQGLISIHNTVPRTHTQEIEVV